MNCPHCNKRLPAHIVDLKAAGSTGGKATGPRKARTSEQAKAASAARWAKHRAKLAAA
jgi:hypothetical protein